MLQEDEDRTTISLNDWLFAFVLASQAFALNVSSWSEYESFDWAPNGDECLTHTIVCVIFISVSASWFSLILLTGFPFWILVRICVSFYSFSFYILNDTRWALYTMVLCLSLFLSLMCITSLVCIHTIHFHITCTHSYMNVMKSSSRPFFNLLSMAVWNSKCARAYVRWCFLDEQTYLSFCFMKKS